MQNEICRQKDGIGKSILTEVTQTQKDKRSMYSLIVHIICKAKKKQAAILKPREAKSKGGPQEYTHKHPRKGK